MLGWVAEVVTLAAFEGAALEAASAGGANRPGIVGFL